MNDDRQASRQILVEMVGIPGSGKSTLCQAVVAKLAKRHLQSLTLEQMLESCSPSKSRVKILRYASLLAEASTDLAWQYKLALARIHTTRPDYKSLRAIYRHVWTVSAIKNAIALRSSDRVILHEGIIQHTAAIGIPRSADEHRYLGRCLTHLHSRIHPQCDMRVVVVQAEPEVALERGIRRSSEHSVSQASGWFKGENALLSLQEFRKSLDLLVEVAARSGVAICTVDATRPVAGNCDTIVDWLNIPG